MSNEFYVYIFYRDENKTSPFYVGKGSGDRISQTKYPYGNLRKANALKKRIRELGHIPTLIFEDCLTEDDAFILEEWLIDYYGRIDLGTGILTNATNGGEGQTGPKKPEHSAKISASKKGRSNGLNGKTLTESHKNNLKIAIAANIALHGYRNNMTTRENMRRAQLGKKQSPEHIQKRIEKMCGEKHPMFGKHHSQMSREKMRAAKLGKKLPETQIAKMRLSATGKPWSPARRAAFEASKLLSA